MHKILTPPFLTGAALFLIESGLQVSGINSLPLAIGLWGLAALLLMYWVSRFQWAINFLLRVKWRTIGGHRIVTALTKYRDWCLRQHTTEHLAKDAVELSQAEIDKKIANNPEFDELIEHCILESCKLEGVWVEERIRPSIKLQFLRWRGFYEFFARSPFLFYWAKRRLEFIDSWRWFFNEHKKINMFPDLGDDRKIRRAIITNVLISTTNLVPNVIYHFCWRPDDVEKNIEGLMHTHSLKLPSINTEK
jgi:hypothetical protein